VHSSPTRIAFLIALICFVFSPIFLAADADSSDETPGVSAKLLSGLKLRALGPAVASGRIGDIAVHPEDHATWYVAVASGNVWKTTDAGIQWTPIFDDYGSYSIGCITIDPNDPLVLWLGTGENNSQRSVSYGDGVYKSTDGGSSWKKVGLENSEHIGKILVDPRNSDVVYVAAQGPLWSAGGDRGLYKTTDGGETWEAILTVDEHTGVTDIAFDPRNPDVLYAATYQRRRHVWVLLNGGPGSGLHKTTDGGKTWTELTTGLPSVDMGRIGIAVSPANPDVVYAIVEAQDDQQGFYRSTNAGGTWEKRSSYNATSPQYYHEIVPDPKNVDLVYSLDTWLHVTEDGGKTFERVPTYHKHVDDHALWIDPTNTDHLVNGNDGGVYESWDRGLTWRFMANLPVTQFYRATADNDFPFYNVYGGTQDNATLGGPSRTISPSGIGNEEWFVTVFGDGFKTRVDPKNPDIIYSQWQYGGLVRHDRKSGEIVDIQPQPDKDEPGLRWNWNSPLIISPHSHTRLYYAANRIFRSDDRGNSWTPVSPDLTRQLDRNELEVMGRVWSVDAPSKNRSTSFYGNIVALSESPLVEGLIYAGTDDGLIQVTEDGGETWREIESLPDVPDMSYIAHVEASLHDEDTVYASVDNHKRGDFSPYVLVSRDRGRSWTSIAGDLPERGTVHVVVQDHVKPELLFAGTEFGLWVTLDEGESWHEMSGGLPTIAVRDLDVQRRETDLVLGTFGRGIYILDDYMPLRLLDEELLAQEAATFPVKDAWMYIQTARLGLPGKAFQGDAFYLADNPPFGAVLTYYLRDGYQTLREARREKEREIQKEGGDNPYPSWDELRAEDREVDPKVVLTVRDSAGEVVRRIEGPASQGIHRVAWDLRYPAPDPVSLSRGGPRAPWNTGPIGPLATPGVYEISLSKIVRGEETPLAETQSFRAVPLGIATLPADDREALLAFQKETAELQRAVRGAVRAADEGRDRLRHLAQAVQDTPEATFEHARRVRELTHRLMDLQTELTGDRTIRRRQEPTPPSLSQRVSRIVSGHWTATSAPTKTHRENYRIAAEMFSDLLPKLTQLLEKDLVALEEELESLSAPWTPGRVPEWTPPR
jgi:photosystem II stability/assembly factor-like uncharacterized protein